jgi:hypothetical protein
MTMAYRPGMAVADKAAIIAKACPQRPPGAHGEPLPGLPFARVCMTLSARNAAAHRLR